MKEIYDYLIDNISINSLEKKLRYCANLHQDFIYKDICLKKDQRRDFYNYLCQFYDMNKIKKDNNSYYAKRQRLKKRIRKMLDSGVDCYFITLTFNDETLLTTKDKTRRKYVQQFLKENCADYVANIDFGKKNGREHYHGVVCCENLNDWDYGFKKYELIVVDNDIALSSYITKLSAHAIKDSTVRSHLIYARQK